MKNKIISKRLVISSIILLFLTVPILTSAELNKNTQPTSLSIYANNSLGTVTVDHQAGLWGIIRHKGAIVTYDPPPDNPNYNYDFLEVNGTVIMNFTLHVRHRLNDVGVYWGELLWPTEHRWTLIHIWVSAPNGSDVISDETKTVCINKSQWEEYDITVSASLDTNGNTTKCKLWMTAWPLYTPNQLIHNICEQLLPHTFATPDIFINPI
jgi:hypothetical protein